jgi:opacity protein-like surface antigen
MKRLLALAFLLAAVPASAQRSEFSLLSGYTGKGEIDQRAAAIQELTIGGGYTWGLQAGHFFSPRFGIEATWAQQESALVLGTAAGSADLFDAKVAQLRGNFVYQLGAEDASWKPFVFAGLGATFFSAMDLESETKLSWALGAGLKWLPGKRLGIRAHAAYNPTRLNDSSSDFCDPFGFCQASLSQFELMGGVVFRF